MYVLFIYYLDIFMSYLYIIQTYVYLIYILFRGLTAGAADQAYLDKLELWNMI